MRTHDTSKVDYTLLEWILALACYDNNKKPIFPVMLGGYVQGLQTSDERPPLDLGEFNAMPHVIPDRTMEEARQILATHNIPHTCDGLTVHAILQRLQRFIYFPDDGKTRSHALLIKDICEAVKRSLDALLVKEAPPVVVSGPLKSSAIAQDSANEYAEEISDIQDLLKKCGIARTDARKYATVLVLDHKITNATKMKFKHSRGTLDDVLMCVISDKDDRDMIKDAIDKMSFN
jgi:hypothetical protein